MKNLKYDDRLNLICWETASSSDFIELRPNEDGPVVIDTIEAFAALPLKADTIVVPYTDGDVKQVEGWRLGDSNITLAKLPGGYSITLRPMGVQIVGGLYKTRTQALDQLPRAIIMLSRCQDFIPGWRTLNF